jgi:hypothetical protein
VQLQQKRLSLALALPPPHDQIAPATTPRCSLLVGGEEEDGPVGSPVVRLAGGGGLRRVPTLRKLT